MTVRSLDFTPSPLVLVLEFQAAQGAQLAHIPSNVSGSGKRMKLIHKHNMALKYAEKYFGALTCKMK
ncbi:hypothetical protein RRG08_053101 [Elysia crispata]|uniref:Uncharacterized protein n=1 Tax=Elysia crispata TaxID=231223 RepID=A0AAE1DKN0_9GAST|nr:hypothetical protein RRG08_053101 [Elysia crispata]